MAILSLVYDNKTCLLLRGSYIKCYLVFSSLATNLMKRARQKKRKERKREDVSLSSLI